MAMNDYYSSSFMVHSKVRNYLFVFSYPPVFAPVFLTGKWRRDLSAVNPSAMKVRLSRGGSLDLVPGQFPLDLFRKMVILELVLQWA